MFGKLHEAVGEANGNPDFPKVLGRLVRATPLAVATRGAPDADELALGRGLQLAMKARDERL
jgi:hypothetical protein